MTTTDQKPLIRITVIAAMKSGSTFLTKIMGALTGLPEVNLSDSYKGGDHDFSTAKINSLTGQSFVAQIHLRSSVAAVATLNQERMIPLITIRNIFDTVVSLRDHVRQADKSIPNFASPLTMTFCPVQYSEMSDDELDEFLIYYAVPWFFSFWAGWSKLENIPVIKYEDLIIDPVKSIQTALAVHGIQQNQHMLQQAVEQALGGFTRKNVGIVGRGDYLRVNWASHMEKLASLHPGTDFKPLIG